MLDEQDVVDQLLITGDLYEQILSFLETNQPNPNHHDNNNEPQASAASNNTNNSAITSSQILLGVAGLRDFFQTYSQFPPAAILAQCPGIEVVLQPDPELASASKKLFQLKQQQQNPVPVPAPVNNSNNALSEPAGGAPMNDQELAAALDIPLERLTAAGEMEENDHDTNNSNNPFHQPTGEACPPPPGFLSDELLVPNDLVLTGTTTSRLPTALMTDSQPHTWNSALFSDDILKGTDDDWGIPPPNNNDNENNNITTTITSALEKMGDDDDDDNQEDSGSNPSISKEMEPITPTIAVDEEDEDDDDDDDEWFSNKTKDSVINLPEDLSPTAVSPPPQPSQQQQQQPQQHEEEHDDEDQHLELLTVDVPQMLANELIQLPTYARICDFLENHPEGCSASRIVRAVNGYRRFVLDFCEENGIANSPFAATLGCCPDIECREDAQGSRRYYLRGHGNNHNHHHHNGNNHLKAGQSTAENPVRGRPKQEVARHVIPPAAVTRKNQYNNKPTLKKPLVETASLVEKRLVEMLRAAPDGKLLFKDIKDVYDARYDLPLDWQKFGFKSLGQMVQSFSSVARKKNSAGGGQLLELAPHIPPSSPSHHPPVTMPGDTQRIPVLLEPLGKNANRGVPPAAPPVTHRPKKSAWDL